MGVAEKDPSPDGATPLAGRCMSPGAHAAAELMWLPFGGCRRIRSPVRAVTPGLTPPGSMISPPFGGFEHPRFHQQKLDEGDACARPTLHHPGARLRPPNSVFSTFPGPNPARQVPRTTIDRDHEPNRPQEGPTGPLRGAVFIGRLCAGRKSPTPTECPHVSTRRGDGDQLSPSRPFPFGGEGGRRPGEGELPGPVPPSPALRAPSPRGGEGEVSARFH